MSSIVDKYKVTRKYDQRIKLTDQQKEEIKELYGNISQRKLARMYGVSRRLIQFIGCPEKHEQNLFRRAERGGSAYYYSREKNTNAVRRHRAYKKRLLAEGLLAPQDK